MGKDKPALSAKDKEQKLTTQPKAKPFVKTESLGKSCKGKNCK